MKIMKFGGTSLGTPERMFQVAELITRGEEAKIVVLSAISGTTNALVAIADAIMECEHQKGFDQIEALHEHYKKFIKGLLRTEKFRKLANSIINIHFEFLHVILKLSKEDTLRKEILAQGELMSTKLLSFYFKEIGVDHVTMPALQFMWLDENDEPHIPTIKSKLYNELDQFVEDNIFITEGYICYNATGQVDNLKRGGSDYTASLIAAAVDASVCEIWTDIDGMHNNDPRIVKTTKPVEQLSFDEAAELAYFGAKILHPASIWPAQHYNIPVKLLNTMLPEAKGTIIFKEAERDGVKAVAAKDGIVMLKIKSSRMLLAYGFLRKIFEVFEKYKTSIDMITTSEVAVSVTIDNTQYLDEIAKELQPLGELEIINQQTIVSVVGNKLTQNSNLMMRLFDSLNHIPINMVSYGGSLHNVSILVPSSHKNETLRALNKGLFGLD